MITNLRYDKCKICKQSLPEKSSKRLAITVRHAATGTPMSSLKYSPPLCEACLAVDDCLEVEVEWDPSKP